MTPSHPENPVIAKNRLALAANGQNIAYDVNGNVVSAPNGVQIVFDANGTRLNYDARGAIVWPTNTIPGHSGDELTLHTEFAKNMEADKQAYEATVAAQKAASDAASDAASSTYDAALKTFKAAEGVLVDAAQTLRSSWNC